MFSVEDLLISHGYTLPPSTHDAPERQRAGDYWGSAQSRPPPGPTNGYSLADPGALDPNKGYYSESEGRDIRPSAHPSISDRAREPALCTSEVGSYGSVPLRWSSRSKTDKDIAYWRRRGQDFSVLLGETVKGDSEFRDTSTAESKGVPLPNGECGRTNDDLIHVGNAARKVVRKDALHETDPGASDDYLPQGSNIGTWPHFTKAQKQMAKNVDVKDSVQDSYCLRSGRDASCSQYKQKSNSLPKALLPENMRHLYLPMPQSNNSFPRNANIMPFIQNDARFDLNKNAKTVNDIPNMPNPRYSRPNQPPSYHLHQQTRQTVEVSGYPAEQLIDEHGTFSSDSEPAHDFNIHESGVEPPVYVPPPSYRSQPEQHLGDPAANELSDYVRCFSDGQLQPWLESSTIKAQMPTYVFEKEGKDCADNHISFQKGKPSDWVNNFSSSVQYIPFDDPRIRHIKLGPTDAHQNNTKASLAAYAILQSKPIGGVHQAGAFVGEQCLLSTATPGSVAGIFTNSNSCLDAPITGKESQGFLDQEGTDRLSNKIAVHKDNKKVQHSQKEDLSHGDGGSKTTAKKFEAETEIQCIASSRKKMNATIFCLVSVPVTTASCPSATNKNSNDLAESNKEIVDVTDRNPVFYNEGFLDSSPTDFEVQVLAGSMTSKSLPEKQEQCCQEEQQQPTDLLPIKPSKHSELKYSGSWPADQYREQQVQTAISQKSCTSQYSSGAKPNERNDKNLSENIAQSTTVKGSKKPSDGYGQTVDTVKGQMRFNPSTKSAFTRTMSADSHLLKPKTCHSQLYRPIGESANGKEQITGNKDDLHKGKNVASCNSAEPFGQFLLKPASRRPCDAISELEILYKELEDGEIGQTGQTDDSVENETQQQLQDQVITGMPTSKADYDSKFPTKYGKQSKMYIQGVPILQAGRVKSKSESWRSELEPDNTHIVSGYELPLCAENHRAPSFRSSDENELSKINTEAESKRHEQSAFSKGSKPPLKILKSKSMNANDTELLPKANFWQSCIDQYCADDPLAGYKKQVKSGQPQNSHCGRADPEMRSYSTKRNSSPHSEPEFSGFHVDGGTELGWNTSDIFQEKEDALEALENETLQTRASRILGIEVAEDSITEGTMQGHLLNSEIGTLGHKYSEAQIYGSMQTQEKNIFVGKEQHSVSENSSSKEDIGILSKNFSQTFTLLEFSHINDVSLSSLAPPVSDDDMACDPISFHNNEKKVVTGSSDKKPRVTSKVIETLQVKLASSPKRTAADRLVRMTEVHSVSRMRRLSIKRSDSGDEADDEKETKKAEDEERSECGFENELPHKVMIQSSAVSKRVISLDERAHSSTKSKNKIEDDIFYIDSYDPTRVERV